jgi:hypothetical protein
MSNTNSALPYGYVTVQDLVDAFGTPLFTGAAGENWSIVLNGLIIQGGLINVTSPSMAVPLNVAFPSQVLGIFMQPASGSNITHSISSPTLSGFTANVSGTSDMYWWAIGA